LELKANEIRGLSTTIDGLKGVNEELKVCHFPFDGLLDRRGG
jgi:hypothetical protein